ncbi:Hormone-sensitive lipase isoform 3 [Schistosoma japonicum]|uniref:Hormone-sensitive lipase isoform 3 n=1 Tax=Schistosoma japonicum TaxID=6182 RepID=A0A4Z2CZ73_SCHJA|nr:Hormone-sensitive lipase isoform 3 [Schistosoma japonicum]
MIRLCSDLHLQCRTYLAIIQTNFTLTDDGTKCSQPKSDVASALKRLLNLLNSGFPERIKYLYTIASNYDFGSLRANGIRSFLTITMRCCAVLLTFIRQMSSYSISNWSGITHWSVIAYINCLMELSVILEVLSSLPRFTNPSSLFPRSEFVDLPEIGQCDVSSFDNNPTSSVKASNPTTKSKQYQEDLLEYYRLEALTDNIKQEYFYGRCLAFYLCPSAQRILLFLNSFMAGYGNSFLTSKQGIVSLVNTVYRSVTSYLSPEDRGKMLAKLTRKSSVQFCKAFWNLAELRVVSEAPNVILPSMAVAHSFKLQTKSLQLPLDLNGQENGKEFINIQPPKSHIGTVPLGMRILCRHLRCGLEWARKNESPKFFDSPNFIHQESHHSRTNSIPSYNSWLYPSDDSFNVLDSLNDRRYSYTSFKVLNASKENNTSSKRSPYILFYIHGGGFIALTSQSQDNFLRVWAEQLDCPIIAVDYSLSPEAPYPRALEECYYAYCWITLNREYLGCTPDAKIVLAGDSAGGNLALGVCMRVTCDGLLNKPTGIFLAYTPVLVSLAPSPSRLLSFCDPLLPIGVLSKCLLAYAGVDEATLNCDELTDSKIDDDSANLTSQQNSPIWSRLLSTFWSNTSKEVQTGHFRRYSSISLFPSYGGGDDYFHKQRDQSIPSNLCRLSEEYDTPHKSLKLNESESSKLNSNSQRSKSKMSTSSSSPEYFNCTNFSIKEDEAEEKADNNNNNDSNNSGCNGDEESTPLKHINRPLTDLNRVRNIHIVQNAFISPYLASDDMLRGLPPIVIVCSHFDPFLDDGLELAKRLSKLDISIDLRVLDDLPHAFLNFCLLGPEFQKANKICINLVKNLFNGYYGNK